jgi:hypothetical protein
VLAGRGGGRGGVVGSTEWPIRAAAPPRANGPPHHHHDDDDDARAFDRPRDDRAANVAIPDCLSICLARGVSFGLAGSIMISTPSSL